MQERCSKLLNMSSSFQEERAADHLLHCMGLHGTKEDTLDGKGPVYIG